jgi:hypothetical protein
LLEASGLEKPAAIDELPLGRCRFVSNGALRRIAGEVSAAIDQTTPARCDRS